MSSITRPLPPPDQAQREDALDARRSILVQAPAGSGKTDLLTRRFLRLLGEVDDPAHIVAITFTRAAAAEMRNRILSELEKAAARRLEKNSSNSGSVVAADMDEFSMEALAEGALKRSLALGWNLVKMPAQLRISTIDSFCRDLALQQPLVSGVGGGLDITENPSELYHRAARRTLEQIGNPDSALTAPALGPAIETLLLWRDNGWQEMENLLATMLEQRDRWMQDFVVAREPDWNALREKLERPFARAVEEALAELDLLLDQETRNEAMDLARFACGQRNRWLQCKLFQFTGLPCQPFAGRDQLEQARQGYTCLAQILLTEKGNLRKPGSVNVKLGFPPDSPEEKQRIVDLLKQLQQIPGFESKLDAVRELPPARYPEDDWQIVRACFIMLRYAAAELKLEFAEAGVVDFVEVAQLAQRVLIGEDNLPSDAALAVADGIHHLLVDEFQDTSRRQHKLISALISAWPDTEGRTLFVVGDPMQSIYFFRDADAELFPRVRTLGLELPEADPLKLDFVPLSSNFRTNPALVKRLNDTFTQIFAVRDGSGVDFSPAIAAREEEEEEEEETAPRFHLHVDFVPQVARANSLSAESVRQKQETAELREAARQKQVEEMVALIRSHMEQAEHTRADGRKYRIAVLGRTYKALEPIARGLREAAIPFRAVDLEKLADRPEVLDALALARALFNPEDRVAWLGVLRAPWCGLSLADLHTLGSGDDKDLLRRPVPQLAAERAALLSEDGRKAVSRLLEALAAVPELRAQPTRSLGSRLEQVWLRLGGADCVDATGRANLDLLWKCLDGLEEGEADLLGPGLDAALEKLTAEPDPAAGSDCGVQLMSIHKSKGLEFEVVIVPDLHAGCGRGERRMLSWLERGIASGDEPDDITEFLVAPLQPKGAESGKCKRWVDRIYRERESQETRRILYVAATRAREELHLFARPEYKQDEKSYTLSEPRDSLLATAWPALKDEVRQRFDAWTQAPDELAVESLAASGADNVIPMPRPAKFAVLHRLAPDYRPVHPGTAATAVPPGDVELYERHEGGLHSRALGSAVHSLLEQLARLRTRKEWPAARELLAQMRPRITAQLRSGGVSLEQAAGISAQAFDMAERAAEDADGQWILSPHADGASEALWAGVLDGRLHEVRVDRVFRAGAAPHAEGDDTWWIIDYKTASEGGAHREETLRNLRTQFRPQLELYAKVLRNLHGAESRIRAGLYYPRMGAFDWWEL